MGEISQLRVVELSKRPVYSYVISRYLPISYFPRFFFQLLYRFQYCCYLNRRLKYKMCGSKEYSKQATLTDEMKQRAITNNILEPRGSEKR